MAGCGLPFSPGVGSRLRLLMKNGEVARVVPGEAGEIVFWASAPAPANCFFATASSIFNERT